MCVCVCVCVSAIGANDLWAAVLEACSGHMWCFSATGEETWNRGVQATHQAQATSTSGNPRTRCKPVDGEGLCAYHSVVSNRVT